MTALLSTDEAAAELKMSVKTLRGHVRDGSIAYIEIGRGTKRRRIGFDRKGLDEFIANKASEPRRASEPAVTLEPAATPAPQARRKRAQKVYFIRAGTTVKIGIAVDPRARLSTLQVAHHERLELLLVLEGGEKREHRLHMRFDEYALAGEWFRYEGALRLYVEKWKAAAL